MVVATRGRLMDLMGEGACSLSKVTYVVLDVADRMLDMGFEKEVRTILSKIPNGDLLIQIVSSPFHIISFLFLSSFHFYFVSFLPRLAHHRNGSGGQGSGCSLTISLS